MNLYCLVSVAAVFFASALSAQGNLGPTLQNLKDRNGTSCYTILKNGEDWTGGPWDDPTEADWTTAGSLHNNKLNAGDYFACYVAPAGRSDLTGHLFCRECLNDWDLETLGTGNRHQNSGWGVSAKPAATSTDPLLVAESEQYWHEYLPQPLDEQSIIEVTWQQKIHLRAEIVHRDPDADQDAYAWLRPAVESISGSDVHITIEMSNGTVHSVTSSVGASVEAGKDGVTAGIEWGRSYTYTASSTLTTSAQSTDDSPELVVAYSVQAPDPGKALITRHKFEWSVHIDDNNNLFTVGIPADIGRIDYSARIQSSVRPKKIVLVQGIQGIPYGRDIPGFVAPAFRNFDLDANLMEAAFCAAIAAVRGIFGLWLAPR